MKRSGKTGGEPYCCLKILNMFLACGILLVAILIFVGDGDGILFPLEFLLGLLMCSLSGIMELSKGKRVAGYFCSVFAGIMMVALIFSVIHTRWIR